MVAMFLPVGLIGSASGDEVAELKKQISQIQKKFEQLEAKQKQQSEQMAGKVLEAVGPHDFRTFWKEGLRFETRDKDFKLKFGGRIMNDWAFMSEDSDVKSSKGDLLDGTEFRRARLYVSGSIYGNVDYKLQFDFAGGESKLKDAYLGIKDLPFGYLTMGHFKEPFGLDELTSSKYITFIERSLPMAFAPSRNTGAMLSSTAFDKRMTWAAGIFRETDGFGKGTSEGGYNLTGRVTALPWYEEKGAKLLHLGVAYSLRNPQDTVLYEQKPEAHLAPYFVDTTALAADKVNLLGLESALVYGPFSVQGEYMFADVNGSNGSSDPTFDGFYAQASYFLTGEHRKYKTSAGSFSRVKPRKHFRYGAGPGAWEVATRYSQIDLNDSGVDGGKLKDVTVGLNWYLNPNMRIMWNYVHSRLEGVGNANLGLMRLQIDF